MNKTLISVFLLFASFTFCHCGNDMTSPSDKNVRPLTALEKTLVDSDNQFGLQLFQTITGVQKDKNVFISPLSISLALGMTLNGANGATAEAMQQTLHLNDLALKDINESYRSLTELLSGLDSRVTFEIANSIWYRQDFSVEREFIDLNKNFFDAQVRALDFQSPDAPATINRWVDENTHSKIKKMVDDIPADLVMYLMNAIYFKGLWTNEFDKSQTRDDQFVGSNNPQIPCRMMVQRGNFKYLETDDFQAIELPYGEGDFSMFVLLPGSDMALDVFLSSINPTNWNDWTGRLNFRDGTIELPAFTMEYEISLNEALKSLGMDIAFDASQADFTKINKEGKLFINEVKHKTFVKVDEEGTEAAAVTSVEIKMTSVRGPEFHMRVDRPFIFAIRENRSGTILFIGKIIEPKI